MGGFWAVIFILVAAAARTAEGAAFQFGDCALEEDPKASDVPWLQSCMHLTLGADITFVAGTPHENYQTRYGRGYWGVHIGRYLGLHVGGISTQAIPLDTDGLEYGREEPEFITAALGNPGIHWVRVMAGRMRIPFGIDFSPVVEGYRILEDRQFWEAPPHGAVLTIDNQVSTQFDLGVATNEYVDRTIEETDESGETVQDSEPIERALSARLMHDIPALTGSRLILSGYGEGGGTRRFGFGFVTRTRKEDITYLEFVRIIPRLLKSTKPFRQLIRFGYLGGWRSRTRWVAQIDEQRATFRRGVLGYDLDIWRENFIFRLAVSFHRTLPDENHRWNTTFGVEASL